VRHSLVYALDSNCARYSQFSQAKISGSSIAKKGSKKPDIAESELKRAP
jgi:hypothetical protein